jgi:hypothetical protein
MTQTRRGRGLALCIVGLLVAIGLMAALELRHYQIQFHASWHWKVSRVKETSIGTAWQYTVPAKTAPVPTITREEP